MSLYRKFSIGVCLYLLLLGSVGMLSYVSLHQMQSGYQTMLNVGNINDQLLEARRFEKNYLLYGQKSDLNEALSYTGQAKRAMREMAKDLPRLQKEQLQSLDHAVEAYERVIADILDAPSQDSSSQSGLRRLGKETIDQSERFLHSESVRVESIIRVLKIELFSAIVAVILCGAAVGYFFFGRLIRALEKFHRAANDIASGTFQELSDNETTPETRRVVSAFNRMFAELDHRQSQLVQSKKLSSLGTLSAGIAHQLNNPLNNIATSGQLAAEELGEGNLDMVRRMLSNVESEAIRAREIVKGLLEFARKKSFDPAPVNLRRLVDKTLRLVSSQLPSGVEVRREVPEELTVVVDSQRFQEALLNLFINAGQAIGDGTGRITVTAEPGEGPSVRLSVADTGPGIAKEDLSRVFDPFFTTKDDGTGLGLSIVYGIVERHGGSIEAQSRPGQGTSFLLTVPAARADDHDAGAGSEAVR